MSISEMFAKVRGRFPSLFSEDTEDGWATVIEFSPDCYEVYSGDLTHIGTFKTKTAALNLVKEKGLMLVD